jgi:hypothetical protein
VHCACEPLKVWLLASHPESPSQHLTEGYAFLPRFRTHSELYSHHGADVGGDKLDNTAAEAALAAAAAVSTGRRGIGAVAAAASDVRRNTTKYADSVESVYRCVPLPCHLPVKLLL